MPDRLSGATRLFPIIGDPIKFVEVRGALLARSKSAATTASACRCRCPPARHRHGWPHRLAKRGRDAGHDAAQVPLPSPTALAVPNEPGTRSRERIRRNLDGTWHGDMLDGLAFVKAQKKVLEPNRKVGRALLVGAGGAGSAIAIELLQAGVLELVIHDADESRVAALLDLLLDLGEGRVSAGPPDPTGCDLVCNASLGMEDGDPLPVDAALFSSSMFVGDVIAGHGVTPFLQAAQGAGSKTANGDHMVEAALDLIVEFMLDGKNGTVDSSGGFPCRCQAVG